MSRGDQSTNDRRPAAPAGAAQVSPRARAAARRVRLALHRRTWAAMWCICALLSLLGALKHWLGDTAGAPLLRHIAEGFVKAIIGTGLCAVALLPILYLGTWAWRALFRRWPSPVAGQLAGRPGAHMGFKRVLLLLVAVLAGMALAVVLIAAGSAQAYRAYQRSQFAPSVPVPDAQVSEEAKREWMDLIGRVIEDPDSLPEVKPRYWQLVREHGKATPSFIEDCQTFIPMGLDYNELLWKDAAVAIRTGKPVKSPERERLEEELIREDGMDARQRAANDAMIADIAAGRPVRTAQDPMAPVTEDYIKQMIAAAPRKRAAVEELLTPPDDMALQ